MPNAISAQGGLIFGSLLTIAGVLVAVWGAISHRRRLHKLQTWTQVEGLVVRDSINGGSDLGGSHAVIAFTTVQGQECRAVSTSMMRNGFDKTGKTVPVWYDPRDPTQIIAKVHLGDNSLGPWLILAGAPCVIGLATLHFAFR